MSLTASHLAMAFLLTSGASEWWRLSVTSRLPGCAVTGDGKSTGGGSNVGVAEKAGGFSKDLAVMSAAVLPKRGEYSRRGVCST